MFSFELLTPVGVIIKDQQCSELTIPTVAGEIQVLANHTHILTQLSTGILTAKMSDNSKKYFAISTGVCKVLKDKISILAVTAEAPEKIDLGRATEAKKRAEEALNHQKKVMSDIDIIKQQRKIERAQARLRVASLK